MASFMSDSGELPLVFARRRKLLELFFTFQSIRSHEAPLVDYCGGVFTEMMKLKGGSLNPRLHCVEAVEDTGYSYT